MPGLADALDTADDVAVELLELLRGYPQLVYACAAHALWLEPSDVARIDVEALLPAGRAASEIVRGLEEHGLPWLDVYAEPARLLRSSEIVARAVGTCAQVEVAE